MMRIAIFLFAALACAQPPPLAVPDNVKADMDVEYSRVGEREAMDVFRPKGPGPFPAVLAIHGGGFRAGSRASYHALCIKLAQRGYVAATASYRLSPRHQFPAAVEDVKAAVRFLRANAAKYSIDPNRIGATGGSAGGHLVLMLGLTGDLKAFEGSGPNLDQSSKVQAVVSYYGPTDFTQSYGKSVDAAEVLPLWLGGDLEHYRKQHIAASPLYYVNPLAAPTLSVHGTKDRYVAYEQSLWLVDKMKAAGATVELETIENGDHGFKGADAERAEARLMQWFDRYLKPVNQKHIFVSDHGPRGEIVEMLWPSGEELRRIPNQRGHDVQPLANGNILYTVGNAHKVYEDDPHGSHVWECCDGLDHPIAAQRLSNGDTVISDAKLGKVIEVSPGKKVVNTLEDPNWANMRSRNVKRTPEGTTLVCIEAQGRVSERDAKNNEVWTWTAPGAKDSRKLYEALRLPNGNTLISLSDPGEVVEVSPSGTIIRSIGGAKMDIQMGWASGMALFPTGNLLISDYTGRRLLEVDPAGKLVNELRLGSRTVASVAVAP